MNLGRAEIVSVEGAALHDPVDIFQFGDVFQGVARDGDEIRELSGREASTRSSQPMISGEVLVAETMASIAVSPSSMR